MYIYLSNSNIICKRHILNFLRIFFPYIHIDLRCEQFINIRILKIFKNILRVACIGARHRNGQILQSKDVRFVFLQRKKDIFPKINFFNKCKHKINKKKTNTE
jgi:hypothetical protein